MGGPAALNLLLTSTTVNAYLWTLAPLGGLLEGGKEDPFDVLHLKIQHLKLVLGYASGQANKSSRWPASTKALQHLLTLWHL